MTETENKSVRKRGLLSLGINARKLVAPVLGKRGFLFSDILEHWEDIVGDVAKGAFPERISFSAKSETNGTLYVKTVSGAHAAIVTARAAEIVDKINFYAGFCALKNLRVTQGARPELCVVKKAVQFEPLSDETIKEIDHTVADIDNADLRDALKKLGTLVAGKKSP